VERVLDLGCGDGRLIALVLDARPAVVTAIGLDNSPPMIDLARDRFRDDARVVVHEHDLRDPLPVAGAFDVVVSSFAIHHLPRRSTAPSTGSRRRASTPRWWVPGPIRVTHQRDAPTRKQE
jgi:SAM-dependent methyltransferase